MKQIMTVMGPITPDKLGVTSMHEHLFGNLSSFRSQFESLIPEKFRDLKDEPVSMQYISLVRRIPQALLDNLVLDDEELICAEVSDFKQSGGDAIVEMSVPGQRFNVKALPHVSEKTGVHVVATTGLYLGFTWPAQFREMTIEQFVKYMLEEIEQGIEDTGIKAGHIKIGIDDLSPREERALRAAARVALQTGLSVTVHPSMRIGADGRKIVKILFEEGMDLKRAIIAHTDYFFIEYDMKTLVLNPNSWRLRLDYAKEILDKGATLSVDRLGDSTADEIFGIVAESDWQRFAGMVALIESGYSSQIVLGTDSGFKHCLRRYGGESYAHLWNYVVPKLRDLGISEYDIRQMTVENPARLLAR